MNKYYKELCIRLKVTKEEVNHHYLESLTFRADKMAQQIMTYAPKFDNPGIHLAKDRTNSHKLSSELHTSVMEYCSPSYPHP